VEENGYKALLNKLQAFLEQTLGRKFKYTNKTQHAVQFVYDGKIEVDLLLSPYWSNPRLLYDFLRTVPEDKRFRLVKEYGHCLLKSASSNFYEYHLLTTASQ